MKPIDLCEVSLLQPFVVCLERRGIGAERYLERQHIPPELVAAGNGKTTRRQCWDFFGDVVQREGIETIGFLDNDPYSVRDLGVVGEAVQRAVTLRDAIATFRRLISCLTLENTVWLEEEPDQAWLCCRGEGVDPEVYPTDHFTLMALAEIVRLSAGPAWRPTAVRLQTGPTRALDQAALVAGSEANFYRRGSGVRFSPALLACPLLLPNHRQPALSPESPVPTPEHTMGESLELLLESMLTHGNLPTGEVAAEILGVHRTTLYRALADEGLTWKVAVDRVRFKTARELLSDPQARIKDVAFASGYANPRNFARAFRRMTGMSPEAFRRELG